MRRKVLNSNLGATVEEDAPGVLASLILLYIYLFTQQPWVENVPCAWHCSSAGVTAVNKKGKAPALWSILVSGGDKQANDEHTVSSSARGYKDNGEG